MNNETLKNSSSGNKLSRISISIPEHLLDELDQMVDRRGFGSRSQALCDMVAHEVNEHRTKLGEDIMTGTINLVFNHSVPGLQAKLLDLQHNYIDEVISALNVNLAHNNTLSVVLVQGPANKLKMIADQMTTLRGVVSGKLLLSSVIIPPIHPLPEANS